MTQTKKEWLVHSSNWLAKLVNKGKVEHTQTRSFPLSKENGSTTANMQYTPHAGFPTHTIYSYSTFFGSPTSETFEILYYAKFIFWPYLDGADLA